MPLIGFRSRIRRVVLTILAMAAVILLAVASPAAAHAELVSSDPADDAILSTEPAQITLTFSEEVDLRLSAIKVIGPDGRRLDAGALRTGPTGGDSFTVALADDQEHGTFSLVWQVTAADDGHSTSGHLTFAVGAPSAVAASAGATLTHGHVTSALSDAAQWGAFVGLALVSGVTVLRPRRAQGLGWQSFGSQGFGSQGLGRQGLARQGGGGEAPGALPPRPSAASLIRQDAELGSLPAGEGSDPHALSAVAGQTLVALPSREAATPSAASPIRQTLAGSALASAEKVVLSPVLACEGVDVLDALPSREAVATSAVDIDALSSGETVAAGFPDAEALSVGEAGEPDVPVAVARPLPLWLATLGWTLLLVATVLQILTYAPASRGLAPSHLFDRSLIAATLATRNGHALMARIAILALAAFVGDAVIRRGRSPLIPLAFTLAVAATWGVTGHAATDAAAPVAMASLTLHVAAMALWVGGLATVALLLLTGGGSGVAATCARFSRLALGAVGVLVATGLYQAWRELGSISALTDSAYGRVLLLKVVVLLVVLAVASRSRALAARWRDGDEAALRGSVLLELAGVAAIVALAVVLASNAAPRG